MALAQTLLGQDRPDRPESLYGVLLHLTPNPTRLDLMFEVQRAPDLNGAPNTGNAVSISTTVGPFPTTGGRFADVLPNDGAVRWYRTRHVGDSVDAGNWSAWVGHGPYRIQATRWRPSTTHSPWEGMASTSSWINPQGSLAPATNSGSASIFSWAASGLGAGQMWASFDWSAASIYRPDGTSLTLPAPPAAPAAPTLGQTAGGVRGALTLFARIALVRQDPASGSYIVYPVSAESSFAVSANNLLTITAPTDPGGGYSGWCVLVGSATNAEFVQGSGSTIKRAFGTNYTEPAGHFTTTNSQWTASWKKLTFAQLDPSTTVNCYPFYDVDNALVQFASDVGIAKAIPARVQNADRHVPLTTLVSGSYAIAASIPAAAGSNSGSGGGGRLT